MSRPLSNYLLSLRQRSGLSQSELAVLLGISGSTLCKLEGLSRRPPIEFAVAAEVVFGQRIRDVFPAVYDEIEQGVVERARRWRARAGSKSESGTKLRTLDEIVERASQTTLGL
jgi:transcriptional regulator with XRE-family HTH domain